MSQKLRLLIALAVCLGLLLLVEPKDVSDLFGRLEPIYLIPLLLIAVPMIWLSCLKWKLFIKEAGHSVPILNLMRLYTVGYFFNTFGPSQLGGDIQRSYQLGKYIEDSKVAFYCTFLERFTGLIAMTLLALIFVLFQAEATQGVEISIYVLSLIVFVASILVFSSSAAELSRSVLSAISASLFGEKLRSKINGAFEAINFAHGKPGLFYKAILLSLAFHFSAVLNTYLACQTIGWTDVSISGLFVVLPLILIVGMIPLTPNGLGIQEGAFVFFLNRIGGSTVDGLAVGLLLRLKVTILAVLGGALWAASSKLEGVHKT